MSTDMTHSGFSIFTELEKWASQLEIWQQCMLSKLINQIELNEDDYKTILQELLWDKKLELPPEERANYPLGTPAAKAAAGAPAGLRAIKSVVGVNALTPNQRLDIGPQLTVVYGPNGSGNSGYARILKASCFTRSKSLDIVGNINVPANERPIPKATFESESGAEIPFETGKPCPELAEHFAVFDSSCIRVYIDG